MYIIKDIIFWNFFSLYSDISVYSSNKHKLKPAVYIYKSLQTLQNHCPVIIAFTPLGIPAHEKWYHNGYLSQPILKSLYTWGSSGSVFLQLPHKQIGFWTVWCVFKSCFFVLHFRIGLVFCTGVLHIGIFVDEVRVADVSLISLHFLFVSSSILFLTSDCSNSGQRIFSQNHLNCVNICCHNFLSKKYSF